MITIFAIWSHFTFVWHEKTFEGSSYFIEIGGYQILSPCVYLKNMPQYISFDQIIVIKHY